MVEDGLAVDVTVDDLAAAIEMAVGRVTGTIERTLADAGVAAGRIDTVFLTGGSTAVPLVRQRVLALFPGARVVDGDLFGSVGMGLTIDAQRRFG
jgi:hypothetical chaperone protein